jgi:hypothetical protein
MQRLDIIVDVFFLTTAALGFLLSFWCTGSLCFCFSDVKEDADTPTLEEGEEMAPALPQSPPSSPPIPSSPTPPDT